MKGGRAGGVSAIQDPPVPCPWAGQGAVKLYRSNYQEMAVCVAGEVCMMEHNRENIIHSNSKRVKRPSLGSQTFTGLDVRGIVQLDSASLKYKRFSI